MKSSLTFRVNSYVAILLVTLVGAGASMLLVRVADSADGYLASPEYAEITGYTHAKHK